MKIKGRVLVVDDEPALCRAYRRTLEGADYEVVIAHDGEAAIRAFGEEEIDAILTDISMPGMTGVELLRRIRAEDEDVPVVLITGGPTVETAIQAMDHGALKYIVKPVDSTELVTVVERAVHLSKLADVKRQALAVLGDVNARIGDRAKVEAAFDRALVQLFMVYQPIVSFSGRSIFGYEALVRSREQELPHPGALFEAAEQLNRVDDLGHKIRSIAPAPAANLPGMLFLNLHPEDLSDERLYAEDSEICQMADHVVLEITERASLDGVPNARVQIARLRSLGFRVAVDDLGAGYAGLTSFAMLEPDVAKLDMGIVRDVDTLPTKQKLVHSMADLCRDMGIALVAEGVETEDELRCLVELGCDLFQGYYFGRPAETPGDINWPDW
ncbi:MAG: EAL domain-containing protein [Deltaproteobacteria bacterium]|nr:EAL domain-containing protein [Deltaproteobacteria bacterium]